MGLLAELNIDANDAPTADDLDKRMSACDIPPEGVHHAILASAGPIPNADGRGWKLVFEIVGGVAKGATVEDVLWKPKGDDAKKDATVTNRILLYGARLGTLLHAKGKDGKEKLVENPDKPEFCDCLGTPCFINVKHEDETYEKNGKSRTIKKAKLDFKGLLGPEDKLVKDGIKAGTVVLASGAAVAEKAKVAASKPKDEFAEM